MSVQPLTHHEIVELVEPFARQGLRVDLAASDRQQRRLVFRSVEPAPGAAVDSAWHESLRLEGSGPGWWSLTRTLVAPDRPGAPPARVTSTGARPGDLLAAVQSLAADRAFHVGAGFVVARNWWLPPGAGSAPTLTGGIARIGTLTLEMTVPATTGVSASIVLSADAGDALQLPQDLLAVLGWNWAPLQRTQDGWKTRVRLRRRGVARTADAAVKLDLAATHLAATLAASPGHFHDRHRRVRWGVVLRRALPSLTAVSLLITVALLPRMGLDKIEGAWTLLYHVPTLLLAGAFMLQEMPRFEIPPWPRRSPAGDWSGRERRPASAQRDPDPSR